MQRHRCVTVAALTVAMAVMGCSDASSGTQTDAGSSSGGTAVDSEDTEGAEDAGSSESGAGSSTTEGQTEITYFAHVRPLLAEHCQVCHAEGSTAPFSLDTYEDVEALAPAIATAVESRTMPPYAMTADGTCGDWASAQWLEPEEIDTIVAWATGSRAAGDGSLESPQPPALPELDGRGDVERIGVPRYEPSDAAGDDDYRCFPIELGLTDERFLTGYDVLPDNAAIVHHLLGYRIEPSRGDNADIMAELDAADDEPGWPCFGSAGEGLRTSGVPVAWAPGGGAQNYPFETGIRFSEGDVLVVQIHYFLPEDGGPDATQIDLQWAESVEREGIQVLWDKFLSQGLLPGGDTLEPGKDSVKFSWDITFEQMLSFRDLDYQAVDLMGVTPHMHEFGRGMEIDLESEAGDVCVADVRNWDFNWQRAYYYEDPVRVQRDAMVHVTCEYDTSSVSEPVAAGLGSGDEMCLMGLYFAEAQ